MILVKGSEAWESRDRLIQMALDEDIGAGDWTTRWTVRDDATASASIIAKERMVVAGLDTAQRVFELVDDALSVTTESDDGAGVQMAEVLMTITGRARSILTAERTVLNFLGRLSGVATLTRSYVDAVAGLGAKILDTRKTTPGWRMLEKAAVVAGGGWNHRVGLYDMVLIKENHIVAAGGLEEAVAQVRRHNRRELPIEVEVRTLEEVGRALGLGVERLLLDNMDTVELSRAVERVQARPEPRPLVEASGNVSLATVRSIAATGVDLISVGALTHSARAVDVSLLIEERDAH